MYWIGDHSRVDTLLRQPDHLVRVIEQDISTKPLPSLEDSEVAPNCRTLQVLILTAILRSKGVFHEQESKSHEGPYGASCLRVTS